jgi:hypothetical protein
VRPLLVVVTDVDAEDARELAAAEDQQPVGALSTCAADLALDVRVRVRRLQRSPDDSHPVAAEEGLEGAAELRVAVMDQQP